jgi:Domain of unknown function (DUF4105)
VTPVIGRFARWIGFICLAVAILLVGGWCAVAVWFRLPTAAPMRDLASGALLVLALATTGCLASSWRWRALSLYVGVVAAVLVWWMTIRPSNDRHWAPDVARTATATINSDFLIVDNVRDFVWRSDTDFDQRWEQRTYRLSQVTGVDLIMSYWGDEAIAHTIVSFGFEGGSRLAFSIEIRRERGEVYSTLAGFFKQYDLAIIAADERDVVRVRSNVRGEDVRIYRLRMSPANAQKLLREYVVQMNNLAQHPRFYNTLTSNCTTLVFDMVRVIHPGLRIGPGVILSGYLPDYVYDLGAVDTSMPFTKLRALSRIHDKAMRADAVPDFSAAIRDGVPKPPAAVR